MASITGRKDVRFDLVTLGECIFYFDHEKLLEYLMEKILTPGRGVIAIMAYAIPDFSLANGKHAKETQDIWVEFEETMKKYARFDYHSLQSAHQDKNIVQFCPNNFQFQKRIIDQNTSLELYLSFCKTLGMYNLCLAENKENPEFVDPVNRMKRRVLELLDEEGDHSAAIRWHVTYFIYTLQ
jgi:hypothetical protein